MKDNRRQQKSMEYAAFDPGSGYNLYRNALVSRKREGCKFELAALFV